MPRIVGVDDAERKAIEEEGGLGDLEIMEEIEGIREDEELDERGRGDEVVCVEEVDGLDEDDVETLGGAERGSPEFQC